MSFCENCWTPKVIGADRCISCSRHPGLTDRFMRYPITCKFGYNDCVNDPGYIYVYHPEWYKELYGNMDLRKAARDPENGCGYCTKEHCLYDDEDK